MTNLNGGLSVIMIPPKKVRRNERDKEKQEMGAKIALNRQRRMLLSFVCYGFP